VWGLLVLTVPPPIRLQLKTKDFKPLLGGAGAVGGGAIPTTVDATFPILS
jgi:hypothetical protein